VEGVTICMLSFEGPDSYSQVGGLGSRITALSSALAVSLALPVLLCGMALTLTTCLWKLRRQRKALVAHVKIIARSFGLAWIKRKSPSKIQNACERRRPLWL